MVDMRARNAKLRRRAEAIVSEIVRCPAGDAARHLEQADGDVKTAILSASDWAATKPRNCCSATGQPALSHQRVHS
jgi:N-acetylmuramic acid 6-phosphate (MurNAc-6-P) etherase